MDPRSGAHTVSGEPGVPGNHLKKTPFTQLQLEHTQIYSMLSSACGYGADSYLPPYQN